MRKVILYIAASLDGYIADKSGGVGWLGGDGSQPDAPGSYPDFIKTIDTVILGYTTYNQIVTELSPGAWPYEGKKCYVLTHRHIENTRDAVFVDRDVVSLLEELRAQPGQDIWICGGASVIAQAMERDLIDRYVITVMPALVGEGVALFGRGGERRLRLLDVKQYDGMVDLTYERRP